MFVPFITIEVLEIEYKSLSMYTNRRCKERKKNVCIMLVANIYDIGLQIFSRPSDLAWQTNVSTYLASNITM